jgi:hypothetical protein
VIFLLKLIKSCLAFQCWYMYVCINKDVNKLMQNQSLSHLQENSIKYCNRSTIIWVTVYIFKKKMLIYFLFKILKKLSWRSDFFHHFKISLHRTILQEFRECKCSRCDFIRQLNILFFSPKADNFLKKLKRFIHSNN